jgi:hypothetical protein
MSARRLLRVRRERPKNGERSRASSQRDELAALHSITSSAAACSVNGTSSPSALAVLPPASSVVFALEIDRVARA